MREDVEEQERNETYRRVWMLKAKSKCSTIDNCNTAKLLVSVIRGQRSTLAPVENSAERGIESSKEHKQIDVFKLTASYTSLLGANHVQI